MRTPSWNGFASSGRPCAASARQVSRALWPGARTSASQASSPRDVASARTRAGSRAVERSDVDARAPVEADARADSSARAQPRQDLVQPVGADVRARVVRGSSSGAPHATSSCEDRDLERVLARACRACRRSTCPRRPRRTAGCSRDRARACAGSAARSRPRSRSAAPRSTRSTATPLRASDERGEQAGRPRAQHRDARPGERGVHALDLDAGRARARAPRGPARSARASAAELIARVDDEVGVDDEAQVAFAAHAPRVDATCARCGSRAGRRRRCPPWRSARSRSTSSGSSSPSSMPSARQVSRATCR